MRDKKGKSLLIAAEALILAAVLVIGILSGMAGTGKKGNLDTKKQTSVTEQDEKGTDSGSGDNVFSEDRITFTQDVEEKIASMTTEEKVAQLFMVTPEIYTHNEQVNVAGAGCQSAINNAPVGGIVCGRNNFLGTESTIKYLDNLQRYSQERIETRLFLLVEQASGDQVVSEPGYMKTNGLNSVILSPVVPMQDADASGVSEALANSLSAYETQEMMGIIPFVPDQIMAAQGADETTFQAYKDGFKETLENIQGVQMSAGACKLITDNSGLPLTFSADTARVLRSEMEYQGLIISANLSDESISASYSPADASVQAFLAGADMLYRPADFDAAYQAILAAAADGTISEDMIHNAVGRILTVKQQM